MSLGTSTMCQIFETFEQDGTRDKVFRRLYCEIGHRIERSNLQVNLATQKIIDKIKPSCDKCQHNTIQVRTIVLLFEELARNKHADLLQECFRTIGKEWRAFQHCSNSTKQFMQKHGICQSKR